MAGSSWGEPVISFVATLYRSELYVMEFITRCAAAAQDMGEPFEIVLVDDGSPDNSLAVAIEALSTHPTLRIVELSRNFGHHAAMLCGLEQTQGDLVFLLDSDLEEDPSWLGQFYSAMLLSGADVIYGVQQERRERGLSRVASRTFYNLRRRLLDGQMPQDVTTARLMRREYVDALLTHRERTTPILDLWVRTGFRQEPFPVVKGRSSPTTYSLGTRASLFLDTFVVGSGKMLVASSLAGIVVVAGSLAIAITLLVRWAAFSRPSPGWTSVMLAVLFLGGGILFTVSLIGLNLKRVADEVRRRPRTIIRRMHGSMTDG